MFDLTPQESTLTAPQPKLTMLEKMSSKNGFWHNGRFYTGKQFRKFVCYAHYVGWENFSLGLSLALDLPNFEIHLPAFFIRIGWVKKHDLPLIEAVGAERFKTWGWGW